MSRMSKMPDTLEELTLLVTANNERIEELTTLARGIGSTVSSAETKGSADKGAISSLTAVLDTLDTQIREGVIASDLARKLNESAEMMEQKGGTANVVVKMQRWVRILRTYGRVDPISSADVGKLRTDLKEWQKEVSQMR